MADCLAWRGAVTHGINVCLYGSYVRDDVERVEGLLAVGAVEQESVCVYVLDLACEQYLPESVARAAPPLEKSGFADGHFCSSPIVNINFFTIVD